MERICWFFENWKIPSRESKTETFAICWEITSTKILKPKEFDQNNFWAVKFFFFYSNSNFDEFF